MTSNLKMKRSLSKNQLLMLTINNDFIPQERNNLLFSLSIEIRFHSNIHTQID